MLKHLYIKNFVLIHELHLEFQDGFSAFVGETGAGKSIMLDAIGLIAAQRASASSITHGQHQAIVEATFDLTHDGHAKKILEDAGFDVHEDMVFTREIYDTGKSVSRIDHRNVSLSLLKDVLANQIDIHSQRDTAYLLKKDTHIDLLDQYMNQDEQLHQLQQAFTIYQQHKKEMELALQETYNENDLEYFQYEIEEIQQAQLKVGEDEVLQDQEREYKQRKQSLSQYEAVFQTYQNIADQLYQLHKQVSHLPQTEQTQPYIQAVQDAYYSLDDGIASLQHDYQQYALDEEEINAIQERLYLIQRLKRKYGHQIEQILAYQKQREAQVEMISHRQEYLQKKQAEVDQAFSVFQSLANQISQKRKKAAKQLDLQIEQILKDLMLPNARFETKIQSCQPNQKGIDDVEFYISMNKGETLKPLSKTASGGELSRLMLGLKVIFTKLAGIGVVIFDEIDTGVSGPVATSIGQKMLALSSDCQVFAVTHLAQVAASSHQMYFVHKQSDQTSTQTSVTKLDQQQSIKQLAMIASGEITSASLTFAEELYQRNHPHG